ncbi:MAG TPA: hypothetical protein VGE37_05585 [Archangium sp.]
MAQNDDTAPVSAAEFNALKDRLARLEAREARRRRVLFGLLAVGAVMAPIALAADGNCPNGLPFCFTADSPAQASQVNHNFSQVKEWIENKAGVVSSNGITARDLTVNGDAGVSNNFLVRGGATFNGGATFAGPTTLNGSTTLNTTTVNGAFNVNNNLLISGTLQANGNFYVGGNSHDDCYTTGYGCGFVNCNNGYYAVGLDIGENEDCGGGGDFDFSSFALRCCRL